VDSHWAEANVFDDHLYPRYRQVDREAGRITIDEPNLYLMPAPARTLIGGVPGHVILSVRYADLWWGVIAALARDEAMQALVGGSLPEGIHADLWPDEGPPNETRRKEAAALARACLFGHPWEKLHRQLTLAGLDRSLDDARVLQQRFLLAFPGLSRLHAQARNQAALPAVPITFPTGMRRTLAKAAPHEIISLRAKGMVGALIKEGILALDQAGLSSSLHAVVGEEFVLLVPEKMTQHKEIETCLANAARSLLGFALPVTIRKSTHWS
jgi:hypothetical protein